MAQRLMRVELRNQHMLTRRRIISATPPVSGPTRFTCSLAHDYYRSWKLEGLILASTVSWRSVAAVADPHCRNAEGDS